MRILLCEADIPELLGVQIHKFGKTFGGVFSIAVGSFMTRMEFSPFFSTLSVKETVISASISSSLDFENG